MLRSGTSWHTTRAAEPATKPTASAVTPYRGPKPAAATIITRLNGIPCTEAQKNLRCAWAAAASRLVAAMRTVAARTTRVRVRASSAWAPSKPGPSVATTGPAASHIRIDATPSTTRVTDMATMTLCLARASPPSVVSSRATTGTVAFAIAPATRPSTRFISP